MKKPGQQHRAALPPTDEVGGQSAVAMLSLGLLSAVLAAGFIVAFGEAEASPILTKLISTLLH